MVSRNLRGERNNDTGEQFTILCTSLTAPCPSQCHVSYRQWRHNNAPAKITLIETILLIHNMIDVEKKCFRNMEIGNGILWKFDRNMVSLLERNPCWNMVAKFFWGSSEAPSLRNSIEIWFHCWKEILVEIWWLTNFEAPLRLPWGSREATLNVLLFKIEWMNRRFGSAWGLLEIGRIPDMCHTSPSVAKFKLCKPEKKNSLLSNTLVPRLTSTRSQAGNLSMS